MCVASVALPFLRGYADLFFFELFVILAARWPNIRLYCDSILLAIYHMPVYFKMSDSQEIECVDLITSDEESVNGYVSIFR